MKTLRIEINETEEGGLETSFGTEGFTYLELLGLSEHVKIYIVDTINAKQEK